MCCEACCEAGSMVCESVDIEVEVGLLVLVCGVVLVWWRCSVV